MGSEARSEAVCLQCGGSGVGVPSDTPGSAVRCANCGAVIRFGDTAIEVHGVDAKEVQGVASALAAQEGERRKKADAERAARELRKAGPWVSGLFYLLAGVVLVGVVLAVVSTVPAWAVPVTLLGALLLLAVVGALQLRHDEKLGEKSFLALMRLALSQAGSLTGARSGSE